MSLLLLLLIPHVTNIINRSSSDIMIIIAITSSRSGRSSYFTIDLIFMHDFLSFRFTVKVKNSPVMLILPP